MDLLEAYQKAADIYNVNAKKCVLNESPEEHWIAGSEDFWYKKDVEDGERRIGSVYTRYRYDGNREEPLFPHDTLARLIAPYCKKKPDPHSLPISVNTYEDDEQALYFTIEKTPGEFRFSVGTAQLDRLSFPLHCKTEVLSPDKKVSLYIKEHNLYCRDNQSWEESQLSFDGEENLDYGLRFDSAAGKYASDTPMEFSPGIVWSPNSRYFLTYRTDRRLLGKLWLTQYVSRDGGPRPHGISYPYALPGDEHILEGELYIGDIKKKTLRKVLMRGAPVVLYLLALFQADQNQVKWTPDGKEAYLVRYRDRFFKTIECLCVNAPQARARVLFSETYKTFGFTEYYGNASQESFAEPSIRYLPDTHELVWHSEIDGWSAFYLIDTKSHKRIRKLTDGQWTVRRLKYLDAGTRTLYFTAGGREAGIDPYYQILYRVSLDGGEPVRLTGEDREHFVRFSPKGTYFLDTCSTIQTAPEMTVRELDGSIRRHLTTADLSRILEKGYITPEPFTAVGRDGVTPIYGILIRPANFDPNQKYPVVDYIYGGSQRINTPKAFEFNRSPGSAPQGDLQSLAQLGFVGIIVDGFATPLRSKAIHDYAYGKAEECCGLEEHILAVRQLAQRFPWIDADRVGIWGASGGGYATARALLQYPDFYRVGVSLCGNHDQARYHAHWGERWIGPYSEERYREQATWRLAENLKGHLLLIHGDLDDNVHPGATMALVKALMDADKDFDFLLYPNSQHGVGQFPYVVRRRWDYFVRHLAGQTPPEFHIRPEKPDETA